MKKVNPKLPEFQRQGIEAPLPKSNTFLKFAHSEANLRIIIPQILQEKTPSKDPRSKPIDTVKLCRLIDTGESGKNQPVLIKDERQARILLSKTSYSPETNFGFETKASNDIGKLEHNFFAKNMNKSQKSV